MTARLRSSTSKEKRTGVFPIGNGEEIALNRV
jgi:hypothetical protein